MQSDIFLLVGCKKFCEIWDSPAEIDKIYTKR